MKNDLSLSSHLSREERRGGYVRALPLGTSLFFALCFFSPSTADAGIAVSPMQQWVDVAPGRQAEFTIELNNMRRSDTQTAQTLLVNVVHFTVSLDGTNLFGDEYKSERSAVDWVTLDTNEAALEPGQTKTIKGVVNAPFNADGDYWCAVMLSQPSPKKEGAVTVALRTACGIFIHVARRNYVENLVLENSEVLLPGAASVEDATSDQSDRPTPKPNVDVHALTVLADVRNDAVIQSIVVGTATIYSSDWRRIASIPMHSHRKAVLPGHTRRFSGVMAASLPEGRYYLRLLFGSESGEGRKITKEMEFNVGSDTAKFWVEGPENESTPQLTVEPRTLEFNLNPGRFTTGSLSLSNNGHSTIQVKCGFVSDAVPVEWIEIKKSDLTLAPSSKTTLTCLIRIPKEARTQEYKGTLLVTVEEAGLVGRTKPVELKVPIRIDVGA